MDPATPLKSVAFADPIAASAPTPELSTCSAVHPAPLHSRTLQAGQAAKPKNTVQTLLFGIVGIMFGLSIMYLISRIMAMNRKIVQLERETKRQVTAEYVDDVVSRTVKELAPSPVHTFTPPPKPPVSVPLPVPLQVRPAASIPVPATPVAAPAPPASGAPPVAPEPVKDFKPEVEPKQFVTQTFPIPFDMGMMPLGPLGMPMPPDMLMELLMGGGGIFEINMGEIPLPRGHGANGASEPRFEIVEDEHVIAPSTTTTEPAAAAAAPSATTSSVDKVVSDTLGPLARVVDALEQESKSRESGDRVHSTDGNSDNSSSSSDDSSGEANIRLAASAPPARRSTRQSANANGGRGRGSGSRQKK